jgi:hypothetical protein
MEAAACAKPATGYTCARREPEKTALFQVIQQHLLTFEQEWTDRADGRTLPKFVTDELHAFLDCGVLGVYTQTARREYSSSRTDMGRKGSRKGSQTVPTKAPVSALSFPCPRWDRASASKPWNPQRSQSLSHPALRCLWPR